MKSKTTGILIGAAALLASFSAQGEFANKIGKKVVGYTAEKSTLYNFPVLVRITSDQAKQCRADGADIRFTSFNGKTPYSHEIDVWNPEGESTVWVRLPEMTNGTVFVMHWGDPAYEGPAEEQAKGAVWSAAGYAGVWHMTEESGTVANVTANGSMMDAVPVGARAQYSARSTVEAPIGYARDIGAEDVNHDVNGRALLKVANYDSLALGDTFTLSGWFRITDYHGNYDNNHRTRNARFFARKNDWKDEKGYILSLANDITKTNFRGGGNGDGHTPTIPSCKDSWVHLAWVFNGTKITSYANGKDLGSATIGRAEDNGLDLGMGSQANVNANGEYATDNYLVGMMDEARLQDLQGEVNYGDWFAAEYAMGADKAFLTEFKVPDNVETMPVLSVPVVTRNPDGTYSVSVGLTEGVATSVKVILNDVIGQELAAGGATEGWSTTETLTGLSADTTYALKVKAVNDDGFEAYSSYDGSFFTGAVTVSNGGDAREEKLAEGAFVFSRPDTDAARTVPLQVFYSVSGTAVAGTDYEALSGTATIPAGEASVRVPVKPLLSIWQDEDVKVTVTMEGGNYTPSDTPASITVFNCRNAALASFTHRTVISFPGYDRDETLEGFPVLVRLSEKDGAFSYADIKRADHKDLVFFDGTGAQLPHEIDTWDENGESLIWVRVRELKRGATIEMYYGGGNAFDNDSQKTWSDYVGVWHLNETGEGAGVAIADSSVHALHGTTPTNAEKIDPDGNKGTDGRIGGARKIATKGGPAELGRILVKNNDSKDLYTGRKVSVSIWCRYADTENWGYLIDRKASDGKGTWGIQFAGSSNVKEFRLHADDGKNDSRSFGSVLSKDTWHHVFVVWNEGEQRLYVDGALKTENAGCNWIQDQKDQNLAIGGLVNDNSSSATWGVFPGDLDEARVSGVVRDTAWALTEYATVADASFSAIGATEELPVGDRPAVDYATYDEEAKTVSLPLLAGQGDVYAIIRLPNGLVQTNLVADGVVAPKTMTLPLSSLPKVGWIEVRLLAVNGSTGDYDERDWSVSVYNHPKPSCIKFAVNGYDGEEVENFPALVRISQGTGGFDSYALFDRETGSDVWFTDEGGNVLPHECESWDPDGESVYWVRMPKLVAEAKIFANYGSDKAPESSAATRVAVWSDQNCVWHAEQSATGHYLNSAQEDMNTARGWDNSTIPADGVVCNGRMISDGAKGDKWKRGMEFSKHTLFKCGGNFTVSLWLKYKQGQAVGYDRIIAIKENYNTSNGWEIGLAQDKPYDLQIRGASETAAGTQSFDKPINDGEWHYLTVVYAGTTAKVYENGVYRTEGAITAASDPDINLVIGNNSKRGEVDFKGTVDEIRLSAGELSAARIKADYLTVSDKSFFTATPYKPGLIVIIK